MGGGMDKADERKLCPFVVAKRPAGKSAGALMIMDKLTRENLPVKGA